MEIKDRPRCLKCKLGYRASSDTSPITRMMSRLTSALSANISQLSRAQVERLRLAHAGLIRASKGRHCPVCVMNDLAFADEVLGALVV